MSYAALLAATTQDRLLTVGWMDLLIVVIYFIAVLAIGFYLKKFAQSGEEFFMAGRKMTAWIAGLSFISANLSSLETMGWSAMAYQYGMLGAHAYLIGAIPAILFLAMVMMPFYYICKTHSVPGYLKLRYGEGSRSLAGISFGFMTIAGQRRQHVRDGQDPESAARVGHAHQHLGRVADRGGLRDAGRFGLGGVQRSAAVLPDLVRLAADPDPGHHPCRRVGQDDGDHPRARQGNPSHGAERGLHQPVAEPGLVRLEPDGHRLVRDGVRAGPGGQLRLLVHGLPAGAAGDRGQEPAGRPERHDHRRGAEDAGAADRHDPGPVGAGRAVQPGRLDDGPGARERSAGEHHPPHVQRRAAAADGPVPGPGPAGAGRHGHDRRVHVGHGGQRQRLRHGLDLRRLPGPDQSPRQRSSLPEDGPLVVAPGRADLDRHGLPAVLVLEHPGVPAGAGLFLHRAAVRRGDHGDALEAGQRRPAASGAS